MPSYVKRTGRPNSGYKKQIGPNKWDVIVSHGYKSNGTPRRIHRRVNRTHQGNLGVLKALILPAVKANGNDTVATCGVNFVIPSILFGLVPILHGGRALAIRI